MSALFFAIAPVLLCTVVFVAFTYLITFILKRLVGIK